jgi:hypothetical protein
MFIRNRNRTGFVCGLIALFLITLVAAQEKTDPSILIKTSISIDTDKLARQKPAIVSITIENVSGRDIDLTSSSFELLRIADEAVARNFSVNGDSYWSPFDISTGTPLKLIVDPKMLKKGVVEGRLPQPVLHLGKDEAKTFRIELSKLLWNGSILSDWPHENLFDVVPTGRYWLVFEISSNGDHKSNRVEVTVE